MIQVVLPGFLRPAVSPALVRIGKDYDGGYLVDHRDIDKSDSLIGLGVNDDWSFEKNFAQHNDVRVLVFDGSVGAWHFAKNAVKDLLRAKRRSTRLLIDYLSFFRGRRRHVVKFVSNGGPATHVTMTDVFETLAKEGFSKPYLKIDIEGSEYSIFEDLIEHAGMTSGLVIELHECDKNLKLIRDFVSRYPLALVHVHANNFGTISDTNIPTVLELTFSSSAPSGTALKLPHSFDMPNNKRADEVAITFA